MKLLELYCGNKNISKAFEKIGWEVYNVDWDKEFNPSLCADISTLSVEDILKLCNGKPNVIWASPDCTTYSISAISHHRIKEPNGYLSPISDYAKFCDYANYHLVDLIKEIKPDLWFIENPRGGFRKMGFFPDKTRYTVTYCQYGDFRQKPTDIYTNHPNPQFKPICHRGDSCHISAPRGSRTGTQGYGTKKDRANIPVALCDHIAHISNDYMRGFIYGYNERV